MNRGAEERKSDRELSRQSAGDSKECDGDSDGSGNHDEKFHRDSKDDGRDGANSGGGGGDGGDSDEDGGGSDGDSAKHSADSADSADSEIESESEESPPLLKYSRMNQLPPNFFKSDPISTATACDQYLIFGTHTGVILITNPDLSTVRSFKAHKASVLSLYTDGAFFASASMDGTVVVGSIKDARDIVMFDYKRPIHAVVLDKTYLRSRIFYCGGMAGTVVCSSKNWLDKRVDTVLDHDNGPIVALELLGDILVWMNDRGVTFYNTQTRLQVHVIPKPDDSFRSDLYWPRVSFPETDRLLIAWGNYIWSVRVSTKGGLEYAGSGAGTSIKSRILPSAASFSFRSAPEPIISVEHVYKMNFLISGIASFNDDQWVVLVYVPPDTHNDRPVPQNPDIRFISSIDGSTTYEEELEMSVTENLGLNDYTLLHHIGPSSIRYLIISARTGVIAQQVQLDDRLQWYLNRGDFESAWGMSQHLVAPLRRLTYGIRHLESLVEKNRWQEASEALPRILHVDTSDFPVGDARSTFNTRVSAALLAEEKDAYVREVGSQWNSWCEAFIEAGHTEELTHVIPTDTRWNLHKSIFTQIASFWIYKDSDRFLDVMGQLDLELFDVKELEAVVEQYLEMFPDEAKVRRALCTIYEDTFEPAKAVVHLRELKDHNIVQFLGDNHILTCFVDEIPDFIKLRFQSKQDIERLPVEDIRGQLRDVIQVLVESRHEIVPKRIIELMGKNQLDIISYFYLEELSKIDDLLVKGFEDDIINLFSQFDRPKLLPFLMSNTSYDLGKAVQVCEMNAFVDELVYLLGKTGENKKALTLIMEEMEDPERAIKFAKLQNDQETWDMLLKFSGEKPAFIKALIEMADEQSSRFYNPITILQKMSSDFFVDGLKESISRVSFDHDMDILVSQLILKIVYKQLAKVSTEFYKGRLRGLEIDVGDAEVKRLLGKFETLIVALQANEKYKVDLASEVFGDHIHEVAFTTLSQKIKHVQQLRAHYSERLR